MAGTTSIRTCRNSRPCRQREALEPLPFRWKFRWNRNGALDSCLDAFSLREPVSTSLENALAKVEHHAAVDLAGLHPVEDVIDLRERHLGYFGLDLAVRGE